VRLRYWAWLAIDTLCVQIVHGPEINLIDALAISEASRFSSILSFPQRVCLRRSPMVVAFVTFPTYPYLIVPSHSVVPSVVFSIAVPLLSHVGHTRHSSGWQPIVRYSIAI
jgi:hypothetical protein